MNFTFRSELIRDNCIDSLRGLPIGEPLTPLSKELDVKLGKVDQDLQGVLDDLKTLSKVGRTTPPKPTSWLVRKLRKLL